MSKQNQLPPRCPLTKKNVSPHDPSSSALCKDSTLLPRHQKCSSQSFIAGDQPTWLDDLLNDADLDSKLKSHRRAASDSGTALDGFIELKSINTVKDDENSCPKEVGNALESGCVYGPNSPRSKENVSFKDNAIVSALSDYASQSPVPYMDGQLFVSGIPRFDSVQEASGTSDQVNVVKQQGKRTAVQRSRVRKIQYIAELEKIVHGLQSMVSQLAAEVESLHKQHAYLSMENSTLKHHLANLQLQSSLSDGQYKVLRKEADGLKLNMAYPQDGRASTYFRLSSTDKMARTEGIWQMLDMNKLQIN